MQNYCKNKQLIWRNFGLHITWLSISFFEYSTINNQHGWVSESHVAQRQREDQVSHVLCLWLLSVSRTFLLCHFHFFWQTFLTSLSLSLSLSLCVSLTNHSSIHSFIHLRKRWWTWWNGRSKCRGGSSRMGVRTERWCMWRWWLMSSWKLSGNRLQFMPPFVSSLLRCTEHSLRSRILQVGLFHLSLLWPFIWKLGYLWLIMYTCPKSCLLWKFLCIFSGKCKKPPSTLRL